MQKRCKYAQEDNILGKPEYSIFIPDPGHSRIIQGLSGSEILEQYVICGIWDMDCDQQKLMR